jgi:hypothetical protein
MPHSGRTKKQLGLPGSQEQIEPSITTVRGHKILLDTDLAGIYGVAVKVLNQAVKRNLSRFPSDFMFQLSWEETRMVRVLRSQTVTLERGGHLKYRPYAFTEHGALMLASILKSPIAVAASIQVVRAFVRLRQMVLSHDVFRARLAAIERRLEDHDEKFAAVFEAIRALMDADEEQAKRPRIGYQTEGLQRGRLMYTTLGPRNT